jgi:hypothetical protein
MSALRCPTSAVETTLAHLRVAGRDLKECVVLWLTARPVVLGAIVVEAYRPEQQAAVDRFRISPAAMTALMSHLRTRKLGLAAQVHSHPRRAFHSRADDKWAVVRHEGALSVVVPHFAEGVDIENFLDRIALFSLSADDRWIGIERPSLSQHLEMIAR